MSNMNPHTLDLRQAHSYPPHLRNSPNFPANAVYVPVPPHAHFIPVFQPPPMAAYNNGAEKRTLKNTSPLRRSIALNNTSHQKPSPISKSSRSISNTGVKLATDNATFTELKSIDQLKKQDIASPFEEKYMEKPIRASYDSPTINVTSASSDVKIYKLSELPFRQPSLKSDAFMRKKIDAQQDLYRQKQPVGPAIDVDFGARDLAEAASTVEGPATSKEQKLPRPSKANPLARVAFIESSEPNDSVDLSFDGKAMNRSDVFKIVDSFCQAQDEGQESYNNSTYDHDDGKHDEITAGFQNISILPPEMTNNGATEPTL
ncbi:LADA_0H05050g1_1 [Lachancea dasiensis]|uniref:LADA_0H05050g1_1 n=1 Tax=Lachancea dasiensis TaxID=1072105 RepID=A0A1G4K120_9SACH|nr:LADA_0H05050g1_1 [Lachancea dasiensis]